MSALARTRTGIRPALIAGMLLVLVPAGVLCAEMLPGFAASPWFGEQTKSLVVEPGILVHLNAPAPEAVKPSDPWRLIVYALPNGNTTSQTIGKVMAPGDDWHYNIQHIGAQTRFLRQLNMGENIAVAYLEADSRSWPSWRKNHTDSSKRIVTLIDELRGMIPGGKPAVTISGHSGGGSLIFGYINGVDKIPAWIDRIVFLDANYAYSTEDKHDAKLCEWLKQGAHHLVVLAYDDRNITLNGKLVVSATGGTYRSSQRMADGLRACCEFTETRKDDTFTSTALDGRATVSVHLNPENKILHTVLVEKNGFIYANTVATPFEQKSGGFFSPALYSQWIQAGSDGPAADAPTSGTKHP